MKDPSGTKKELTAEISALKKKIQKLEKQKPALKPAKKPISESSHLWSDAFDAINGSVCLIAPDGMIIKHNKATETLLGKSARELDGHFCFEVVHGVSKPLTDCPLLRMKKTKRRESTIIQLGDRWLEVTTDPVKEDNRRIVAAVHIITDITERKLAEDNLHKSEGRYKMLFTRAAEGILVADLKTRQFRYANPALCNMFGYTEEEMLRLGVADIHPKESLGHVVAEFEAMARGEKILVPNLPCLRKDGTVFYANISTTPMDLDGIKCNVGFFTNITAILHSASQREAALEALRASEENFRRSLDDSPLGVRIVTAEGETIYANRAILDFYGYESIEELKTTPVKNRYTSESYAQFQIRREKRKYGVDRLSDYEISIIRKNGEVRHLHVFRKEILWNGERQYQVIYQDITREQEALQKFNKLFNSNPALMAVSSLPERKFVDVNNTFLQTLGYTNEEVIGKTSIELGLFVKPEKLQQVADELQASGRTASHELKVKAKDGTIIDGLFSGEIIESQGIKYFLTVMIDQTERRRTQEALKAAEETYRNMFLNAQIGLFRTDIHTGLLLDANDCVARFIGYKDRSELLSKPFSIAERYIDTEDRKKMLSILKEHGYLDDYEARFRRNDGKIIWMRYSGKLVPDKGWFEGVSEDITKEKEALESLRKSEHRYRLLIENANESIMVVQDGLFKFVNSRALESFGYSEQDLLSTPIIELIHPEDRDDVMERYLQKINGDATPTRHTYRANLKSGQTHWIEISSVLIDWEGRPATLNLMTDITARKQAEDELRESEDRFRTIFEQAHLGIVIASPSFTFNKVNAAFCSMMGYSADELRSMTFADITHPDYLQQDRENVIKVGRGEIPFYKTEKQYIHKNGNILWGDLVVSSVRDENGLLRYYLSMVSDITARKQAEESQRILEERLQQADKMEAIGTLAGGIAHDFNNLLMGIQGYASMTLMNIDPANPNYERLKNIEQQVQSGADLTSQLLGFARGGRYEVKPSNINEIIEKTSSMFGRTKKEITLQRKLAKDIWNVEVDRGQIERVFLNMYVNAWQAMPRGGDIYLETRNVVLNEEQALLCSVKPGKHVKISITDTGIGMDEKTKERIFDPFFTTKEMGRGTGLGLATVYGIIKGHHGMIHVESVPGQGATFTIHLPATDKEIPKEKAPTGEIITGTETILLVDDEKMVMEVNRELLESMGYKVYVAGSGQEGIALYTEKKDKIDLIILDMIMPGISGSETFDRLRKINPKVKVLLSSGYSLTGEAQTIMDRGCNGFLQKPFRLEELSGKVREVLD